MSVSCAIKLVIIPFSLRCDSGEDQNFHIQTNYNSNKKGSAKFNYYIKRIASHK